MAEQIPPEENSNSLPLDLGDNPPEPTLGLPRNDSLSASTRAERGSPAPELLEVDSLPETPAGSSVQLIDPSPSGAIADPFQESTVSSTSTAPEFAFLAPTSQQKLSHPSDPQSQQQIDPQFLSQLVELGFDEWTAKLALVRTKNIGVEAAVNWIIERSNESDFESESSAEEAGDSNMGASQSGEASTSGNAADFVRSLAKSARTHKMIFVANMSLKMGAGKLAAQVGHACLAVYQKAMSTEEGRLGIQSWERMGAVKVVVKGESTEQLMELLKQAKEAGCVAYLVADAGYTQIPSGSRTVLGVFGPVESVDQVTGNLKLL